jgi:hypothetical protein
VRQPGTSLCWRRCPFHQTWNPSTLGCDGDEDGTTSWCYAAGEDDSEAGGCVHSSPELGDWCQEEVGGGYRIPTAMEYSTLLEESALMAGGLACNGDDGDTVCTSMFGLWIQPLCEWSSDRSEPGYGIWAVLYDGVLDDSWGTSIALCNVRCVKTGP